MVKELEKLVGLYVSGPVSSIYPMDPMWRMRRPSCLVLGISTIRPWLLPVERPTEERWVDSNLLCQIMGTFGTAVVFGEGMEESGVDTDGQCGESGRLQARMINICRRNEGTEKF